MSLLHITRRGLHRLHMDRAGDMVQKILIIACVALPILVVLLTFRKTIGGWFQTQSQAVTSGYEAPMDK